MIDLQLMLSKSVVRAGASISSPGAPVIFKFIIAGMPFSYASPVGSY